MNNQSEKDYQDFFGIPLNRPFAIFIEIIGGFSIGAFLFWILLTGFNFAFQTFTSYDEEREQYILQLQQQAGKDQEIKEFGNPSSKLTVTKPEKIRIPKIDVNSKVLNPESPIIEVLDGALKEGAVRYPGSGVLEDGNIFIFGHSTNWVVVQNKAYKTFNGLEKLVAGDIIYLEGNEREYSYVVEDVTLVDENEAFVDLTGEGRSLTISTCNSFGKKQERWVVQARYAGERELNEPEYIP